MFDHAIFAPGRVMWDNFDDIDPDVALVAQESLIGCEDVLAIQYGNGVWLDVRFLGRSSDDPVFVVGVSVPVPEDEWKQFAEQTCRTSGEVVRAVTDLIPVARDWKG